MPLFINTHLPYHGLLTSSNYGNYGITSSSSDLFEGGGADLGGGADGLDGGDGLGG